jgi:nucleoid-associated protein YgaU
MNKPEPPKKIESLPLPKPPEGKKPEVKKTGWEPPAPQVQRAAERKLGMLLAVCLLVALGFVAHQKFNAKKKSPTPPDLLAKFDKLSGANGETQQAGADGTGLLPPTSLNSEAESDPVGEFSPSSTPAEMSFARSSPQQSLPEQSEPATGAAGMQPTTTPTFELGANDAPPQSEPEAVATDNVSNPFFTAAESSEPSVSSGDAASDPFSSGGVVANETAPTTEGTSTFSSDASSPYGAPADPETSQPSSEVTFSEPPTQLEPEPPATDSSSAPVDLFTIDPVEEPTGEQQAPVAVSEAEPPQLLEPNDAQVMPALKLGPFDTAASEPPPAAEPTVTEPAVTEPAGSGFQSFPEATVETPVHQRQPVGTPADNPFANGGGTTVVEESPRVLQDPFAPAHDVHQAVSENVEVIHEVQSGDNFWSIAKQHYGSGKYFTALAAYNKSRIPDPQRIRPGTKVQVPSEAVLAQQFPQLVSGTKSTPYAATPAGPPGFSLDSRGRPQYRVAKGDTLSDIAQRHLGRASRWRQIFGMNMDQLPSAESLTTGMVLRLPTDASQIPMSAAEMSGR